LLLIQINHFTVSIFISSINNGRLSGEIMDAFGDDDEFPEHTAQIRQNWELVIEKIEELCPLNWIPVDTGQNPEKLFSRIFRYKYDNFRYKSSAGDRIIFTIKLTGHNSGYHPSVISDISNSRWSFEIRAVPEGNPKDSPRANSKSLAEFRDWFFELLEPMPKSFQQLKKLEKMPEYNNYERATGMLLFIQDWKDENLDSFAHTIGSTWSHIDQKISLLNPEVYFNPTKKYSFDLNHF
jgi:hypothetical protein